MERDSTDRRKRQPTILLMDDNKLAAMLVKKRLSQAGYAVMLTDNHTEAQNILGARRIDVVLVDARMQKENGFDIMQITRDRRKISGRHIPLIALAENAVKAQREKCLKDGFDEYLPKPVFEKELLRILEHLDGDGNAG